MAAFIAPLIGGLAGLFGGGKQQKTQTSGTIGNTQQGTFNQTGTTTGSTTGTNQQQFGSQTVNQHNLSPFQQMLAQRFTSGAGKLADQAADLTGYTAGGLQDINSGANANNLIQQRMLESRGLAFSPAAATAETQNLANTQNKRSQFLQQVPLLQRQLQERANTGLEQAFSTLPVDTTSTTAGGSSGTSSGTSTGTTEQSGSTSQSGTQTQQGTNLVSGNPMGGLFSGLGAGLLGPNSSGTGSNFGDIASILQRLFGGGGEQIGTIQH